MEATQSMVFERTAKPLLPGVLDGYNATVFAYGVSSTSDRELNLD
jgi:kinesin family protein 18/19